MRTKVRTWKREKVANGIRETDDSDKVLSVAVRSTDPINLTIDRLADGPVGGEERILDIVIHERSLHVW